MSIETLEKGVDGQRVEMRVYRRRCITSCCLVICEFWPDWLFTLIPLGWGNIRVFCDVNVKELASVGTQRDEIDSWEPLKGLQIRGALPREPGLAWVSGSKSFVQRVMALLEDWWVVVAMGGVGRGSVAVKGRHQVRWNSLAHQRVGGMTTSRVCFCIPRELIWREPDDYVVRSVRHVAKYGERTERPLRQAEVNKMSEPGRKPFLGPDDLIPRGATDTLVAVATHMSATGWGLRKLTAQEIMLAWDLPAAVAEGAGGISDFEEDMFKSLEESCPIKMLHTIAEVVTEQGIEKGWIEDSAMKEVNPVKTQEGKRSPRRARRVDWRRSNPGLGE